MDYSVLEKSTLFRGIPAKELRDTLETVPHHIQCYDKGEVILRLMDEASRVGIILEGRAEAQKPFPNGSQINVSIRMPGEMIGPAAVFSTSHKYPCDVVAIEPITLMMFRKKELMLLMQKDVRILENFTTEIASATYMLQQRLELLSYSGIAQKAAYYLLMQSRKIESDKIPIPDSMTKWAMLLNVSRPSLHRELKRLESQNMIQLETHHVEILEPKALQDVLTK
ncbi:MAG: Crp/Fnr family transcriptional regulator [Lachnospiraceae bacterium]|nr:Crp/Fnr family transcriptional regulator [Lachnospiraceae bacterium]